MSQAVLTILERMQLEMERLQLWQSEPPSAIQLQSRIPFCMDSMSCSQWLQWVYIARLRALLEAKASLPKGAQVHPYAEESFKVDGIQSDELLALIQQLDNLLT